VQARYPIGKRLPCEQCPPPDREAGGPPDEQRCTYDSDGGEEVGWRRCQTRARWTVVHVTPGGTRSEATWPQVCERHRRALVKSGHILLEPLPLPYGYSDDGWDVVEPFRPENVKGDPG
jgi:hypothetical protein